ncbi:GntR family transcriptional regulator [bacterium LRH843]|nr:GntR family transcriptional regulator [bacterium LRH843]
MEFIVDKTKSIHSQVYEMIKDAIIKLYFAPGQRISEKELSDKLNVSRTPIREAFIRLSETGLLEVYPQRGTFVTYININDVYEALFVRESLEVTAIQKSMMKINEQDITLLETIIAEQRKYHREKEREKFYSFDEKYHETLMGISGYTNAWNIVLSSKLHLDRVRYLNLRSYENFNRLIDEHEEVLNAIKAKNVEKAQKKLSEHISRGAEESIELISEKYKDYILTK